MSVAIQLVCGCGRRSQERIFDGSAPRAKIEDMRASIKGWQRMRRSVTSAMEDFCPGCAAEHRSRKAGRNADKPKPKGGK